MHEPGEARQGAAWRGTAGQGGAGRGTAWDLSKEGKVKITKIAVRLEGLSDIMFDRFYDHSKEDRPPERKLHLNEEGEIVLPAENIHSFLFRDMPPVGVIRFVEKKAAKDYIAYGQAHVAIQPTLIPFVTPDGKPIRFTEFGSGFPFYVNDWSAGVTKMSGGKALKQEVRKRPVLRLPWWLSFDLLVFPNDRVTPEKLLAWFEVGGLVTALGTYRPRYGRFLVKGWTESSEDTGE